ncbi:MerR family transcriptional regulator [Streptomyces oceani]|uniref:HTH merR-type domain-containing protein n=1 Tax=Streptomyces oceani TaxID=1075402 RepID=A0A1E7KCS7_9ACTN|nr:MerR family transcriptional regulator [Streptomyces oceani]OEV01736.1 hypothetical protein AN216_17125 [Streptomyces oceani]
MQIGELSERTGASRRSIRYYEQHGLLTAQRTSKGWRTYEPLDVTRVRNVRELLAAGLTMEDIQLVAPCLELKSAEFMACDRPEQALEMYESRLAVVESRAAELERHRAQLISRIAGLRANAEADPDSGDFAELLRQAAEADTSTERPQRA